MPTSNPFVACSANMRRSPQTIVLLSFLAGSGCRADTATPADATKTASGQGETISSEVLDEVTANMDLQADPCTDFYRYACGGWMDSTPLPPDEPRFGRFNVLRERNAAALKEILAVQEGTKLGNFYQACMDEAAIEERGAQPLEPLFEEVAAVDDLPSLMHAAGRLHRSGVHPFFSMYVSPDYVDPSINLAHLGQGGLGLPDRDYYLGKDEAAKQTLAAYERHIAENLERLGDESAAKTAKAIVAFETKLAEVSKPRAELRDPEKHYNRVTAEGLAAMAPQLPWASFLEATGYPKVNDFNAAPEEFFVAMAEIVASTEMATLRDYLRWQVLETYAEHLSQPFAQSHFEFFRKTLRGQQEMAPRWKRCVDTTDKAMGEALGQHYVEQHFAGDSREIALEMIHGIEAAFEEGLPQLSWMDATTRERAVEKMKAVVNKIGHPEEWKSYDALEVGNDYTANLMAAFSVEFDRNASKIGQAVDRKEWHMSPPTVNAYYNPSMNEMVFPAGILQPPFFSPDFPMAMNFGGIGMVMGHELTHGFDDQGRKFDGRGSMSQWWEAEATERFEERAQCVADLYSGYEVQPGVKLNGKLTLGENIADLGGIKEAFRAYQAWAKSQGVDPEAPATDGLTQEQLFFVSFGQIWCSKATPEVEKVLALTDPHSHPRYRVNGPLSQLPEFWETFSCDAGEPMRPENVCEVW